MTTRAAPRALARSVTAVAAALLVASSARAEDHIHVQTTTTRGDDRAALLLLSFLVPLPLPLALVAPPSSSRPPVAVPPSRRANAPRADGARLAARPGGAAPAVQGQRPSR